MPRHIRRLVLLRDDHKCVKCGSEHQLTVDHIIPLSKGGRSHESNYQTLCDDCNQAKGNALPE